MILYQQSNTSLYLWAQAQKFVEGSTSWNPLIIRDEITLQGSNSEPPIFIPCKITNQPKTLSPMDYGKLVFYQHSSQCTIEGMNLKQLT